jgi:hypothetical protein
MAKKTLTLLALFAAGLALALGGCGSEDDNGGGGAGTTTNETTTNESTTTNDDPYDY